jgi:hypothetical protein
VYVLGVFFLSFSFGQPGGIMATWTTAGGRSLRHSTHSDAWLERTNNRSGRDPTRGSSASTGTVFETTADGKLQPTSTIRRSSSLSVRRSFQPISATGYRFCYRLAACQMRPQFQLNRTLVIVRKNCRWDLANLRLGTAAGTLLSQQHPLRYHR